MTRPLSSDICHLSSDRLAKGGTVTFPRPRRTPIGQLAAAAAFVGLWALLWFALGLVVGGL